MSNINKFASENNYKEIHLEIDGEQKDFTIFDWEEVKTRAEDGTQNIYEYFIGWEGEAYDNVDASKWVPFAVGGMNPDSLKYDGGFQESGNSGMIFADISESSEDPSFVFVGENGEGESIKIDKKLSELELIVPEGDNEDGYIA